MPNFSINRHHSNKQVENPRYYRDGFKAKQLTLEGLAEVVKQGYAVSFSTYKDNKRSKANFIESQLIGVDIDAPELSLQDALKLPFVQKYCKFIYTTASHQKEKNGVICDRYRLVFQISQPLTDIGEVEQLIRLVCESVGGYDKSALDASRFWAGNNKAEIHWLNGADLPLSLIEEAQKKAKLEAQEREKQRLETLRRFENQNLDDVKELALQALEFIPPRQPGTGTYEESLRVLMSLKTIFGEFEAIAIAESWSPPMKGWNPARKIQGFREGEVTAGTLFHIAKEHGFKFPEREYEQWPNYREPDKATYDAYVETQREKESIEDAIAQETQITLFKRKLTRTAKRLSKRLSSFIATMKGLEFSGNRAKQWMETLNQDNDVLDNSFMGSGKSHAVPSIENSQGKIWYISRDHRNPSIQKIEDEFTDLMPRSQWGFYYNDEGRLVEANNETPQELIAIAPNCKRGDMFKQIKKKGLNETVITENTNGEKVRINPVCGTCPFLGTCQKTQGWYRYERKQTLLKDKIRCHIESMPRDYDYHQDIVIFDEPTQLFQSIKSYFTNWNYLLAELDSLRDSLTESDYQVIDEILQAIKPLFFEKVTQDNYYGIAHKTILNSVTKNYDYSLIELLIKRVTEIKDQALFNVFGTRLKNEVSITDQSIDKEYQTLKKFIKRKTITEDEREKAQQRLTQIEKERSELKSKIQWANASNNSQKNYERTLEIYESINRFPPNGIIAILKALTGYSTTLRIHARGQLKGKMQITEDNRPNYQFLDSAKKIFLDATATPEQIQQITGFTKPIIAVREKADKPLKNQTIYQVKTEGIGSKQVSNTGINRVRALIKRFGELFGDIATIGHKSMLEQLDIDGYWFRDNRGSNKFEGQTNLLTIGLPYPNVGAIEDECLCLFGTLERFKDYYSQKVNEEILQLTGRQRVNRYPDQKFNLFMLTPLDADLKWLEQFGANVIEMDAVEICPQAGNRSQVALLNIAKAFIETGATTQSAIAEHLGITRQAVSKLLRDNGLTLSQIIEQVNCQPTLNSSYKDGLTLDGLVNCMRDLLDLDPIEMAEEVITAIKVMGWKYFVRDYLSILPEPIQHKVLGILWALLDTEKGGSELALS
ncbi:MAG: PriCT-2 domain-containing protein [Crocosphaera sp.]